MIVKEKIEHLTLLASRLSCLAQKVVKLDPKIKKIVGEKLFVVSKSYYDTVSEVFARIDKALESGGIVREDIGNFFAGMASDNPSLGQHPDSHTRQKAMSIYPSDSPNDPYVNFRLKIEIKRHGTGRYEVNAYIFPVSENV